MGRKVATKTKERFWRRHRYLKYFLVGLVSLVVLLIALSLFTNIRTSMRQSDLQPFYDTKGLSLGGPPGQIVRQEPLGVDVDNGTALRVLYRTQKADGSPTFSSGMIF